MPEGFEGRTYWEPEPGRIPEKKKNAERPNEEDG